MGCHFLLQGVLPTQGLNPGLPHCRQILYSLSYREAIFRGRLLLSVTEQLSLERTEVSLGGPRAPCGYQHELRTLTSFKSQFHSFLTVQSWINYLGLIFSSANWGCYKICSEDHVINSAWHYLLLLVLSAGIIPQIGGSLAAVEFLQEY